MNIGEYMCRAEQFTAALHREEYNHLSGLKREYETREVFEEFADLFSREAVLARLELREGREGRYLAEFALRGHIDQRLRGLTEHIANAESAAEVDCAGERMPFLAVLGELTQEADRGRRRAMEEAVAEVMARHNDERAQRIGGQRQIAQDLGFADYRALCEEISGQPLRALGREMAEFLNDSEPAYRARIEEVLAGAGSDPGQTTDWELRRAVFAPGYADLFLRGRLVPAAEATLSGLGVTLSQQPNVRLDLEPRPRKYPRPFCVPIAVPGEIWVVASPRGGCVDFLSFFHEMGHAQHFAGTNPELPSAFRIMGDDALAEAFAFLLQSVVLNAEWLEEVLGVEAAPAALLRSGQLIDFWYVRRYAGKIAYELELHGGDGRLDRMDERYSELLGDALDVRVAPEAYLFDVDDWFYCARYLRAWMLESCLQLYLRDRFGRAWYRSPEAGKWLRSLWWRGTELTADELAEECGLHLGLAPLRERLLGDA